jgi:hypothetical protein
MPNEERTPSGAGSQPAGSSERVAISPAEQGTRSGILAAFLLLVFAVLEYGGLELPAYLVSAISGFMTALGGAIGNLARNQVHADPDARLIWKLLAML